MSRYLIKLNIFASFDFAALSTAKSENVDYDEQKNIEAKELSSFYIIALLQLALVVLCFVFGVAVTMTSSSSYLKNNGELFPFIFYVYSPMVYLFAACNWTKLQNV